MNLQASVPVYPFHADEGYSLCLCTSSILISIKIYGVQLLIANVGGEDEEL
jgi:hypothetical protein